MDQEPQKNVLDYANPAVGEQKGPGCGSYGLLWVGILISSFFFGLLAAQDLGNLGLCVIPLALVGVGIYWDREDFSKDRRAFFLNVLIWLSPTLIMPLFIYPGYQKEKSRRIRITPIIVGSLERELKHVLEAESQLPASQQRPANVVIQTYLNSIQSSDKWGRPYRFTYPGTHKNNEFDLFSAGPDGVYGNGDDIGNW